jgi:hypothetical protein
MTKASKEGYIKVKSEVNQQETQGFVLPKFGFTTV